MVTTLTNIGWSNGTSGVWTTGSNNVIDTTNGIYVPSGTTVNTFSGNDSLTGAGGVDTSNALVLDALPSGVTVSQLSFGIENLGTLIMGSGINSINGTATGPSTALVYGVYNEEGSSITMNGNGNSITGTATGDGSELPSVFPIAGIFNRSGSITMGNGNNNSITGTGTATGAFVSGEDTFFLASGIFNRQGGTIALGDGNNNAITGVGGYFNGIFNRGSITIGNGNNASIRATGVSDGAYGIYNNDYAGAPTIRIGNGNNASITATARGNGCVGMVNEGSIAIGDGNNTSITGTAEGSSGVGIVNLVDILMGRGTGRITGSGTSTGIFNSGTIDVGAGNDQVIANGGFDGGGDVFMGDGNDYLKGFGSGKFYGGQGRDILELTAGTYEVSIGSGQVNFKNTSTGVIMNTFEFETLTAGNRKLDFSSLSIGQTFTVA